jgi:hypothetical protein
VASLATGQKRWIRSVCGASSLSAEVAEEARGERLVDATAELLTVGVAEVLEAAPAELLLTEGLPAASGQAWSTALTLRATGSGGHGEHTDAMLVDVLVPAPAPRGQTGIGAHAMISAVFLPSRSLTRVTVEASGHGSGRQIIEIGPPVTPVLPVATGLQHGQMTALVAPVGPIEPCGR